MHSGWSAWHWREKEQLKPAAKVLDLPLTVLIITADYRQIYSPVLAEDHTALVSFGNNTTTARRPRSRPRLTRLRRIYLFPWPSALRRVFDEPPHLDDPRAFMLRVCVPGPPARRPRQRFPEEQRTSVSYRSQSCEARRPTFLPRPPWNSFPLL